MNVSDKKSISSKHSLHSYERKNKQFIPIIYDKNYEIFIWSLELIHPLISDINKWTKVDNLIKKDFKTRFPDLSYNGITPSHPITDKELSLVHSKSFICHLKYNPLTVVNALEMCALLLVPICFLRSKIIKPIKWQTSGSILGGFLALKYGWAINLGGGFLHCSANIAQGFCLLSDITLTIRYLWQEVSDKINVLIVDLDAHQGNGYARDVLKMSRKEQKQIYIMDVFNPKLYPGDDLAMLAIDRVVNFKTEIKDKIYLDLIDFHLKDMLTNDKFKADLIIYNAGTDILKGDRLGEMNISSDAIVRRDQMVFEFAKHNNFPILMLLSGGFNHNSAEVIAFSIENLFDKKLIKPIE